MHKNCFKLNTGLFLTSLVLKKQTIQSCFLVATISSSFQHFNTRMPTCTKPTFKIETLCIVSYVHML